jgi:hypothetical protein
VSDPLAESRPTATEIDPAIVTAAQSLLPGASRFTPVGDRPFLVRASIDGNEVRLRRWPDGTVPERVRFVTRLQSALAEGDPRICAAPFRGGQNGEPFLQVAGAMVDVQEWLPGHPSAERSIIQLPNEHTLQRPAELTESRLDGLIALVAALHDRSSSFTKVHSAPVAPIPQVLRAISQNWRLARLNLRPSAHHFPPIQRWLRMGEQVLPAAEHAILEANLGDKPPVVAHLSHWPAHVLVDRATTTGLLDFNTAVVTTPLLDIAQLAVRFPGWTIDRAELVLGRYTDARPLTPDERRVLPAFAAMDVVVEAARLLRYGYVSELPAASKEAVAAREGAQDLLNSLEAVVNSVVRSVMPVAKKKSRFQSSSRAGQGAKSTRSGGPARGPRKRRNEPTGENR